MKGKITILAICLLVGCLLTSGGYGNWQKDLIIKGNITVAKPEIKPESKEMLELEETNKLLEDPGIGDLGTDDTGAGDPEIQ